jgi:hypothetical protein
MSALWTLGGFSFDQQASKTHAKKNVTNVSTTLRVGLIKKIIENRLKELDQYYHDHLLRLGIQLSKFCELPIQEI